MYWFGLVKIEFKKIFILQIQGRKYKWLVRWHILYTC